MYFWCHQYKSDQKMVQHQLSAISSACSVGKCEDKADWMPTTYHGQWLTPAAEWTNTVECLLLKTDPNSGQIKLLIGHKAKMYAVRTVARWASIAVLRIHETIGAKLKLQPNVSPFILRSSEELKFVWGSPSVLCACTHGSAPAPKLKSHSLESWVPCTTESSNLSSHSTKVPSTT
jgi:hypothetical protein